MQFPLNHFIPDSSITSSEVASHDVTFDLVIDKLNFRLKYQSQYLCDDLIYHFDKNKIEYEDYSKKLETGIRVESFIFFYNRKSKSIYKIITNPNFYNNCREYVKKFKQIVPKSLSKLFTISQTDFTINIYNIHYSILLKMLNVKQKQSFDRVKTNRIENRTHYIGAEPNETVFYDKKYKINKSRNKRKIQNSQLQHIEKLIEKSDQYKSWAVLEVKLSGDMLPTKNLKDFFKAIQEENFNPFKSHELINYRLKKDNNIGPKLIKNYYKIKETINCLGFFEARKKLNKNRKFSRDFKKVTILGEPLQFGNYYHSLLKEYLEKGRVRNAPRKNKDKSKVLSIQNNTDVVNLALLINHFPHLQTSKGYSHGR